MNWHRSVWMIAFGTLCVGCDSNTQPKTPTVPAASEAPATSPSEPAVASSNAASMGTMLDHPEYANWSRFPVGTSIMRKRTVTNEFGEVKVTTRMWLESKSEKEVVVGSQINVERPGQPLEENPDNLTTYPARFRLPEGMDPNLFLLPTAKAKRTGEEVLTVDGREIKADVYEWQESNETGPMDVKLWRSIDVPGRIVRQEMNTLSSQTKTIEAVEVFKEASEENGVTK